MMKQSHHARSPAVDRYSSVENETEMGELCGMWQQKDRLGIIIDIIVY
jgi:hypothetical protein